MATRRKRHPLSGRVTEWVDDPLTGETAQLQAVQPYQAKKEYVCPGCNQEIRAGTGHVAVVPLNRPAERRHWHRPCLDHASRHGVRR